MRKYRLIACVILILSAISHVMGQAAAAASKSAAFAPLEQWKTAVVSGNSAALKAMYSASPAPKITTVSGDSTEDAEIAFWTGLKPRRITLKVAESTSPQSGLQQVVFEAEVHSGAGSADHVVYVTEGQLWQQQLDGWKLVAAKRSDASKLEQPTSTGKVIYAPGIDAQQEIKQALARAAKEHKNVLIVFGANWCYDCHVLDLAFQRPDLAPILQRSYEVVHVDIGEFNKNVDLMQKYNAPAQKVPSLAVLDAKGKLLYSQQGGEFSKARALAPEDIRAFLNKWKPGA